MAAACFLIDNQRWLTSFLNDWIQQMIYDGRLSAVQRVWCGVLRGPLLFTIYTARGSSIVISHGCCLYLCADDTQEYLSVPVYAVSSATAQLFHCIANVATWFRMIRLRLNPAKTQLIWLGLKWQIEKVDILDMPIVEMVHVTWVSLWTVT